MKNAPLAKGVRLSESRIGQRQEETAIPWAFSKPIHSPEDCLVRIYPHHSPLSFLTVVELGAYFINIQPEGGR